MSRHRGAYTDDDMYDYDDYDDDGYYDDDDQEQYTQPTNGGGGGGGGGGDGGVAPKGSAKEYVLFVMESLGTVEMTASGGRVVGGISEARVLQMLEAYDCDVERTIDYFLTQRQKAVAPAPVPPKPLVTGGTGSKAGAGAGTGLGKGHQPGKSKPPPAAAGAGVPSVSSLDVSAMGLTGSAEPAGGDSAAASKLLVASAPLSDDDEADLPTAACAPTLPHLTLVVAGHVDAGKSTLVGNLLYKVGSVAQRTIHKYEKEAKEHGKGSFALAWVMDESQSEREHGVTIDLAERVLKTDHRHFTVLDAPGHRDFIPNMISGAAQADVALLVIPATAGEYESSMSDGAQTREHAVLLRALGVKQVVVVVNKMDSTQPAWDRERFQRIERDLRALLGELQFPPRSVRVVPVSGLTGQNLVGCDAACPLAAWYTGKTLLETMNSVRPPTRRVRAPLRAVVTAVVAAHATVAKGCEVAVAVLQGQLRAGRGVGLTSAAGAATAKNVRDADGGAVAAIAAGCKGVVHLVDRSGRTGEEMGLTEGTVLCKGPPLPRQTTAFKASMHTLAGLQPPIIPGSTFELYLHGGVTECRVTKLYSMNANTSSPSSSSTVGGVAVGRTEHPKCVPGGRTAKVKIEVTHAVCIEPFKVCNALGRFALRSKGKTCAVGVCEKVKTK